MTGALNGIRVAAFTHFAAGPIAAQYLGALGADVIKIESPKVDVNRYSVKDPEDSLGGVSPYFLCTNRNQRSIVLDLKSDEGKAAAQRIVAECDVVLENFRPGVLDRLGFGFEALKKLKKDAILCSFSAYDAMGSARDRPGQDLLMQAASGLANMSGRASNPPTPVGVYVIDGFTAMQGVIGVLAALRHRDSTGEGQWVRADMMSTALYMMTQEASFALNAKSMNVRPDSGVAHSNHGAPYGIYETKDGSIALSVFGGVEVIKEIARALGAFDEIEESLTESGLKLDRDLISRAFQDRIGALEQGDATKILTDAGAWVAPVRTLQDALSDPISVETGTIATYNSLLSGAHKVVTEPLKLSETPLARDCPAPAYGEHTLEVLGEFDFSEAEIHALVQSGAAILND